jgi:hypothetical protein
MLSGILTDARGVCENAQFPMDRTPSGIITEVRGVVENAESPMATTAYPPNVDGIIIAPPGPVYPVMVAKPPLTE